MVRGVSFRTCGGRRGYYHYPHTGEIPGKEQAMKKKQRVAGMANEILARQARARAERTGEPFEEALKAVRKTEAGRQLEELGEGPHRHERADHWQEGLARERTEERADAPGWSSPADPVGRKEQE
jgi:hypothetical protein